MSRNSDVEFLEWPHTREWLHQVLTTLWGGEGYLPEKLGEKQEYIPTLALGGLADVYILASTHNMQCESLWEDGGILLKTWKDNGEVLSRKLCYTAQKALEDALGIDPRSNEKPPPCDITRLKELGDHESNLMIGRLSKYLVLLEAAFDVLTEEIVHLRETEEVEKLQQKVEDRSIVNSRLRLPIAGFIRDECACVNYIRDRLE